MFLTGLHHPALEEHAVIAEMRAGETGDPAEGLSAIATAWWRSLGARSVQVLAPRGAPGPDPGGRRKRPAQPGDDWSVIVEDVDGAFRDWLLKRPSDNVIVLRPDRYVAAVCPLGDLEQVTGRLRRTLG